MFRRMLAVFFFALVTSAVSAVNSGPYFEIGVGFGAFDGDTLYMLPDTGEHYRKINYDSLYWADEYKFPVDANGLMLPAFHIGWEQTFSKVFSVRAGVGLAFFGAHWKSEKVMERQIPAMTYDSIAPPIDAQLMLTYLHVPVDIKALIPIKRGGFYLAAGPRIGFRLGASFEDIEWGRESDEKDLYSPIMIAMGYRVGGEVFIKKVTLLIDAGYDWGLNDAAKSADLTMKPGLLTFNLGMRFGAGQKK